VPDEAQGRVVDGRLNGRVAAHRVLVRVVQAGRCEDEGELRMAGGELGMVRPAVCGGGEAAAGSGGAVGRAGW